MFLINQENLEKPTELQTNGSCRLSCKDKPKEKPARDFQHNHFLLRSDLKTLTRK